ncbi:MAG: hypothetical protein ABI193_26130, partial [Minicystis sp.]
MERGGALPQHLATEEIACAKKGLPVSEHVPGDQDLPGAQCDHRPATLEQSACRRGGARSDRGSVLADVDSTVEKRISRRRVRVSERSAVPAALRVAPVFRIDAEVQQNPREIRHDREELVHASKVRELDGTVAIGRVDLWISFQQALHGLIEVLLVEVGGKSH